MMVACGGDVVALFWLLVVAAMVVLVSSSAANGGGGTTTTATKLIDLSYQPHLSSKILASHLLSSTSAFQSDVLLSSVSTSSSHDESLSAASKAQHQQQHQSVVTIDASHSKLGDDGIVELVQQTIKMMMMTHVSTNTSTTTTSQLHFNLEMNQISPSGVTRFLSALLDTEKSRQPQDGEEAEKTQQQQRPQPSPRIQLRGLDLSWNRLISDTNVADDNTAMHMALHTLLTSQRLSLNELCLACTGIVPSTCRAIAKGIVERWIQPLDDDEETLDDTTTNNNHNTTTTKPPEVVNDISAAVPLSLILANNPEIGDAGLVAIAAAIRRIVMTMSGTTLNDDDNDDIKDDNIDDKSDAALSESSSPAVIFDMLDVSACDITDVGVEALVLALEVVDNDGTTRCCPIRHLRLCHNRITDQGALSLGRALQQQRRDSSSAMIVDLSHNPKITDRGIGTLLDAVECGAIQQLIVRSCSIHADGTELVGATIRRWCTNNNNNHHRHIGIDLSGNPIGLLRGKSPSDSGGGYSASYIKSKASATASACMTQGLNLLKKGIGGFPGVVGVNTVESDDEAESPSSSSTKGTFSDGNNDKSDSKSDTNRCGFKALASAFLGNGPLRQQSSTSSSSPQQQQVHNNKRILLGLRRTFCDTAGADALAAIMVAIHEEYKDDEVHLELELDLNPVMEDEMIAALQGKDPELLAEMADRYTNAMEVIRTAQERASQAAQILANRRPAAVPAASAAANEGGYLDEDDVYDDDTDQPFMDEDDEYFGQHDDDAF